MIILAKVTAIGSLQTITFDRTDGSKGSLKKIEVFLKGEFNEMVCEATGPLAEDIEENKLLSNTLYACDINIALRSWVGKESQQQVYKNTVTLNKIEPV